ncbi:MAG TPA: thioesterase family protein [Solirubrobacteraceae bacterium]|nr:thioesterase family protein [Solirubrobacteraceae bacterium]
MADGQAPATSARPTLSVFDRDTAVSLLSRERDGSVQRVRFAADVSPDWRAGRGPHGGYLAAMLLRALTEAIADPERAPRSLTIHYARAPQAGPVSIAVAIEREGRSLSTLTARMEQDGALVALALAAFSVPWSAPLIAELPLPEIEPQDAERKTGIPLFAGAPPFTRHLIVQPRIGAVPFQGSDAPMELGSWLGLAEERPIDALSLAFFSDALFSPPFIRLREPSTTPTIDLTIHFRTPMPRSAEPDPAELCFARFRSGLIQEGFFEEDGVIWAADGTVLAQSRQLGIVLALPIG